MPVCCVLAWPHVLQGGAFICGQEQNNIPSQQWDWYFVSAAWDRCLSTLSLVAPGRNCLVITVSIEAGVGAMHVDGVQAAGWKYSQCNIETCP